LFEKKERVLLSSRDTGFVDRLRKELEVQNCEVLLAECEVGIIKAIRDFSPTLLILRAEEFRDDPTSFIRTIRGNKDMEKLPILACADDARIMDLEEKFREDPTVVVTTSFITTYISNLVRLKSLFKSEKIQ